MPYIEKTTKAGRTVLIERCYSSHIHPPGEKREKKEKKTSEAQEKVNLRKTITELTILMNENFQPGDYHVTLTYAPDERPEDLNGAKTELSLIHIYSEIGHGGTYIRKWRRSG